MELTIFRAGAELKIPVVLDEKPRNADDTVTQYQQEQQTPNG